jgi:small subunit ribosomal protein S13
MVEEKTRYIVRIVNTDLDGSKPIYRALKKIKGIGFSASKMICNYLGIDYLKKAGNLTDSEVEKIQDAILGMNENFPSWVLNRRKDFETGVDRHIVTSALNFDVDNDIKRMKKIRCYKGVRHILGQPVRGQRTRAHFRHGVSMGVRVGAVAAQQAAAKEAKEPKESKGAKK